MRSSPKIEVNEAVRGMPMYMTTEAAETYTAGESSAMLGQPSQGKAAIHQ